MTSFAQALKDRGFVVTAELDPPRGVDLGPLMELAGRIAGQVDALVISDNQGANLRQSPWWAAHRLAETTPAEVILTLTCRDRNRLALAGDILAAAAAGVDNLLLVSGDFISLGDHPQAKPVYDLDSVQALMLAQGLAQGHDLNGQALAGAPELFLGAVLAPEARPLATGRSWRPWWRPAATRPWGRLAWNARCSSSGLASPASAPPCTWPIRGGR